MMNQKISISETVEEAIKLWRKAMKYNLLFSLLYFGLLIFFTSVVSVYTGVYEKFTQLYPVLLKNPEVFRQRLEALSQTPEVATYILLITVCSGLVYPLHIGLLNVLQKLEKKEEIVFNDLLDGYNGINFFKYASYYICWMIIYNFISGVLPIVGGILWIMLTLLIVPLMYFRKEPMGMAFIENFAIIKKEFPLILASVLFAAIFAFLGLFAFGIGYFFTFPIWCSVVYILYNRIYSIKIEN